MVTRKGRGIRNARSAFTMVEIALSTTVVVIALASMSLSIFSLHALRQQSRERSLAHNAMLIRAESVHAAARAVMSQSGGWAQNLINAQCPANSLERDFDVPGLNPQDGQAHVGKLTFVVDETETDSNLGVSLGMPRDLDGDGVVSSNDVRGTARILPVIVRVKWKGARGNCQQTHPFVAIGY